VSIDTTESVLMTADDLAAALRISTRTLWRLRSASKLPQSIRLGGSVRWRASDIEAWIAAGCPAETVKRSGRNKS